MADKQFPVDIYAAKKYGIEKWQREFFWPVTDKDFASLYVKLEECFKRHIKNESPETGSLLLLQADLRFEYLSFIHALKVAEEIRKRNMPLLCTEKSLWYGDIPASRFGKGFLVAGTKGETAPAFFKSKLSKAVKNVFYNAPSFAKDFSKKAYVYSSVNGIMEEYMRKAKQLFLFTSSSDWFSQYHPGELPDTLIAGVRSVSEGIVSEIKDIAVDEGVCFSKEQVDHMIESTSGALLNGAEILLSVRKKIAANGTKNLLISSFGNSFLRAVAMGMRQTGGKVTSFSHGGNIGIYNTPTLAFSEFALSDEFFTYTGGSARNFEENKKCFPPVRNNDVAIRSLGSDEYLRLWKRYGQGRPPGAIKRVMVVGYPHNQLRKPHAAAGFSLMQLDFELRLVSILRKAGYKVIYKAHPDKKEEVSGIFGNDVKFSAGYFEGCMDEADAYIFGSIRTTAFPTALCTKKPLIAFVMSDESCRPMPQPMELLAKRCAFINTRFDERNRIMFDEDALLDLLAKPVKQPDNEFIEKYYFP